MNELSCRKVRDLLWAAAGRAPIAAPIAPTPASFRKPRREVVSMLSLSCFTESDRSASTRPDSRLNVERPIVRGRKRQAPFDIDPALGQLLGQATNAELS